MFLSLGGVLLSLATLVLAGRPRWDLVVLILGSQTIGALLLINLEKCRAFRQEVAELAARETLKHVLPHLLERGGRFFRWHSDGSLTEVILPGPDMPEEARQRLYGIVAELRPAA